MSLSKLKIAMLAVHSCPVGELGTKDTGGMSVYIRELARELGEQGHMVDVYTRIHDPADPIMEDLGRGARLIHLKAGREAKINKMAVYSYLPDFTRNLEDFRIDNSLRYDIIFSHYWLSGWVGNRLTHWWQVPHVVMFHTLGAIKNAISIGEDEPEIRILTEKEIIHSCRRVIVATEREKTDIGRYYGAELDKIGVVPCGVNMELFRPVAKNQAREKLGLTDEKILLFVGRIDPLKGIDNLIRAIPLLNSVGNLKLVIIGGDANSRSEVEKLQKLSIEIGVQDKVAFQGIVKQPELPYYYSAADICVVPSFYESFGLVALESLACGTPVVAADVGDLRNIILRDRTGYVLEGNTPQHLAEGITRALSQPAGNMERALSVRASVSGYSWHNIALALAGELRQMLEKQLSSVV